MKNLKLTAILFACLAFFTIQKTNAQMLSENEIIQKEWGQAKSDLLKQYLNLSEGDVQRFTPIYDKYAIEHQKLGAERIQLIKDYANKFDNLTEKEATGIVDALLKNNKSIDALHLKYFNMISQRVSPTIAVKFIQLELYIQSVVRMEVQDQIPFVEQLQHNMKK